MLLTMLKLSKYVIFTSETSAGFSKVSGKTVDVDEGGGDESDTLTPLLMLILHLASRLSLYLPNRPKVDRNGVLADSQIISVPKKNFFFLPSQI